MCGVIICGRHDDGMMRPHLSSKCLVSNHWARTGQHGPPFLATYDELIISLACKSCPSLAWGQAHPPQAPPVSASTSRGHVVFRRKNFNRVHPAQHQANAHLKRLRPVILAPHHGITQIVPSWLMSSWTVLAGKSCHAQFLSICRFWPYIIFRGRGSS